MVVNDTCDTGKQFEKTEVFHDTMNYGLLSEIEDSTWVNKG